ncbi:MAG: hypothetical protein U0931_00430 [Vulcanimicrobiota bacterium]
MGESHRTSRDRGTAILSAAFLSVAAVGLLFVLSGSMMLQNGLLAQPNSADGAQRLAESAIQVALARLKQDPNLNPASLPEVRVELPSYPEGYGVLGFDPKKTAEWQLPASVNNLLGAKAVPGWGDTVVAPATANLVSLGRYRGFEYRAEAVLYVPNFPYVVSSSVPVKSLGGLNVFGISGLEALARGFAEIPQPLRRPGHVLTNAQDHQGLPAMQLLGDSHIDGDVQSHGDIEIRDQATVTGEKRSFANSSTLPAIDVRNLDTASRPGVNRLTTTSLDSPAFSGFNRAQKSLTVTGGLNLDNGILFVDGDLKVSGGIKGKGAVIATGNIEVSGGGVLVGDSQSAILAHGSVSLQGTASQRAEYRGLLYAEGNLNCKYANIAGPIVVNNPESSGGATLEQVTLVESKELAVQAFNVRTQVEITMTGGNWQSVGFPTAGLDASKLPKDANGNYYATDEMRSHPLDYARFPAGPPSAEEAVELSRNLSGFMDTLVEAANLGVRRFVIDYTHPYDAGTSQQPPPDPTYISTTQTVTQEIIVPWTLDLDQFTQVSDRIRILSWRHI